MTLPSNNLKKILKLNNYGQYSFRGNGFPKIILGFGCYSSIFERAQCLLKNLLTEGSLKVTKKNFFQTLQTRIMNSIFKSLSQVCRPAQILEPSSSHLAWIVTAVYCHQLLTQVAGSYHLEQTLIVFSCLLGLIQTSCHQDWTRTAASCHLEQKAVVCSSPQISFTEQIVIGKPDIRYQLNKKDIQLM